MHWYHAVYLAVLFSAVLAGSFLAVYVLKKKSPGDRPLATDEWQNTFDATPDLIAVIDANYRVIRANRAMADALGMAPGTLCGATCYRVMHCAEGPVESCPHRLLMTDGNAHTVELYEPTLRGHFLVSASPLYDGTGRLAGSVHVARNITDRRLAEIALEDKSHALAERVKELNCLYGITEIMRRPGISLEEIMRETVAIVPPAWQYPGIACARMTLDDASALSERFGESPWRQAADIVVSGRKRGTVEVFYLEERDPCDEGPFLHEERYLIDAIAERVGWVVERQWAMNELMMSETILRDRNSKLEFDLQMAHSAQKGIMRLHKPESAFLAVDFRYVPMDQVGGDYFSFFEAGDGSIGCFIGDISGHGIAAALFIALIKSITDRVFRESAGEPDVYLGRVNDELLDYISSNFVTAIYGIFSRDAGDGTVKFRYSNGAHVKPILVRKEGGCEFHGAANSLVGVFGGMEFDVNEVTLRSGDRLLLLTDAIPETIDEDRKMVGFGQGLLDLVTRCRRESIGDMLDEMLRETERYRNSLPQNDDITIIGFEAI